MNRRNFLKTSLLTSASFAFLPGCKTGPSSRVIGANSDVRVAVIGLNGRGKTHIEEFRKVQGGRLVALCDPDRAVLDKALAKCREDGDNLDGYTDIRKLLESKNVDAVSIATPNHWHALGSVWAIQAGKDVYVEKPVSHNVWEGRQIVNAAHKYHRIVQAGVQIRSNPGICEAREWVLAGNLGKIQRARGLCYKRRPSIGKTEGPQAIPSTVDYDLWCGPAPKEPLRRKSLHYDWHWVWPTGNGDVGNQGIHQMDLGRWFLNEPTVSPRILSVGGRLGYDDDGTTPNTQIILHDYPAAPLFFEVRGLFSSRDSKKMDDYHGASIGLVMECEGGMLVIPSYTEAIAYDKTGAELKRFKGSGNHFANFIEVVHSRREEALRGKILEAHLSSALCHTGNLSHQLGKPQSPEEIREAVKDTRGLGEALGRMEDHLAANQVDLQKTPATLGALLTMDPATERFIDNPAANELLNREYRAPFVVPKKV
jgi:predicted dehydrogenase